MDGVYTLIQLSLYFLLLFAAGEVLYHFLRVKAEHTRKIIHIGTGLLTLLFPIYFQHVWQAVAICSSFLVLLLASKQFRFLPSINAVERQTSGSILYPIIVIIVFVFYHIRLQAHNDYQPYLYFYLPILIMAISDPIAALAGTYFSNKQGQKTLAGSIAFFISAAIIAIFILRRLSSSGIHILIIFLHAFLIATLCTVVERVSKKGWDNFTIPIAAMAYLLLIESIS